MIFINWNANSVKNKSAEIAMFISEHRPDVMGFCETKLDSYINFRITSYKVYRRDRNRTGGGVALAIKSSIPHQQIPSIVSPSIESVGIKITLKGGNNFIYIYSVYCPPKYKFSQKDIKLFTQKGRNVIVMGDFNAKHIAWNCPTNNKNGVILSDLALAENINIFAPELPTYYPSRARARPSIIDLVLTKGIFLNNLPISLNALNSDHNPIMFKINERIKTQTVEILDYKNTNWPQYKTTINNSLKIPLIITNRNEIAP
jgi:hypothetical protein